MKKVFCILTMAVCCLFVATTSAQAQFLKWGIKGGVNMSKIDFDDYKDKMGGFFIGPMAEATIPIIGLGVDAALLFSQKGVKSDIDGLKQNGLDIPINLKYTIGLGSTLGIFVAAGPDFFFDFKGNKDGYERKKTQVGVNIGAGLKLVQHLQIGVNYNIPVGDHFTWKEATQAVRKGKDKTWQISLAYLF